MTDFTTQRAMLKKQEPFIKTRAWFFSRRGLPHSLEMDDLMQVGRIATTQYFEKNGWQERPDMGGYLSVAVEGAMLKEINRARTGVGDPVDNGFAIVPFSALQRDGDEDEFDLLASSDVEQFSFATAPIEPPQDPAARLAIYQAAAEQLAREFRVSTRYEEVRGLQLETTGEWTIRFTLLQRHCNISGFKSRKDAAAAKYELLTRIRDAVLPIDPKGVIGVEKPRNKFLRLGEKSRSLNTDRGRRTSVMQPITVHAQFLYGDPLRAMLILEQMCLRGLDDWTALHDIVPGVA